MSKVLLVCKFTILCWLLLACFSAVIAAPKPETAVVEAEDLETGAAAAAVEKDDLEGSSSYGYGYYSSPYLYGGHLGGYGGYGGYGLGYPYYGGYYGIGYPYYGGYYGGYHGLHGHYF
ncbi:claw keratin [Stomoxys calcitrans]|uniref:claw keratin n=1 Tax=Stomoxys calcitrans TaxID=35570 RepID=UPI0027E32807|nr:claw keratin [Stomoxys calcitrans]